MTASLPRQAMTPDEPPPEDRGHRIRRRALTLLIIVLLIGVPAGDPVISAEQSRDSGKDKERKWAARGLTKAWPSKVQRHIYEVPVPRQADGEGILSTKVAYYETNNWRTSRLYVQFMTTNAGLDYFFKAMGVPAPACSRTSSPSAPATRRSSAGSSRNRAPGGVSPTPRRTRRPPSTSS